MCFREVQISGEGAELATVRRYCLDFSSATD